MIPAHFLLTEIFSLKDNGDSASAEALRATFMCGIYNGCFSKVFFLIFYAKLLVIQSKQLIIVTYRLSVSFIINVAH